MVRPGIDLQLAQLLSAETVVREHALDGAPDDLLRSSGEQMAEGLLLEALWVAAVPAVELALELVAGHRDLRRIQHDDVIARVQVGLVRGLVLAHEDVRDARGEAAECLVRRVHDVPASLDLALPDRIGLRVHRSSCSPFVSPGPPPRATRLRQSPLAGADAPRRAGPEPARAVRTAVSSIVPRPTSRRTATILRTIPR